jgi:hypothetical protein
MELKTGDKLFALERRLYCVDTFPYVFVVHSVTPKLAYIQPFDNNDYQQSSKYTVYRTLVSHESRFIANWRGKPHPAFSSSFDYLWLWDEVCKIEYLQSALNLKIKRYLNCLRSQSDFLNSDNFRQNLKVFETLTRLFETLNSLSPSKSKDLVFSETELKLLEVQTFNQILEDFSDV